MEVSYGDETLREMCETVRLARRRLGAECARKLSARVSDLKAASVVTKLPAGKPRVLDGDRTGHYAISLAGGFQLLVAPNQQPLPRRQDGATDWELVNKILVTEITDHD